MSPIGPVGRGNRGGSSSQETPPREPRVKIRDIVAILKADGRGEWKSAEISALMSKGAAVGDLITKQNPERIFTYYLATLFDDRVLEELE